MNREGEAPKWDLRRSPRYPEAIVPVAPPFRLTYLTDEPSEAGEDLTESEHTSQCVETFNSYSHLA